MQTGASGEFERRLLLPERAEPRELWVGAAAPAVRPAARVAVATGRLWHPAEEGRLVC